MQCSCDALLLIQHCVFDIADWEKRTSKPEATHFVLVFEGILAHCLWHGQSVQLKMPLQKGLPICQKEPNRKEIDLEFSLRKDDPIGYTSRYMRVVLAQGPYETDWSCNTTMHIGFRAENMSSVRPWKTYSRIAAAATEFFPRSNPNYNIETTTSSCNNTFHSFYWKGWKGSRLEPPNSALYQRNVFDNPNA